MKLYELYDLAEKSDIPVICRELPVSKCMSLQDEDGCCYIAIDPFGLQSVADETYKLAHDLGHCMTGAFYNRHSPCDTVGRSERRADVWAIKKLIPKEELEAAVNNGHYEFYDLADYFNLPEDLVRKACEYYQMVS